MTLTHFAIIAVCAYLLGSLSFAIIVSMFWLKVRIYQVKVNPKFGYSKLFSYFWDRFRSKM